MDEQELKEYFAGLSSEQILEIALRSVLDCERLRRELDESNGVIR